MNNQRRARSASDKMTSAVMVIIIALILALAVFATYGKVADKVEENAIANGTKEQTVGYAAKQAGQTIDEYLEQYGLSGSKDVTEKTPLSEMYGFMTLEKYLEMSGEEKSADDYIKEAKLEGQVTKDSLWKDVEPLIPAGVYFGSEDTLNQIKQMYGIGDEITADTPWGEAEEILNKAAEEMANATPAPTDEAAADASADTDAAADAPADDAADTSADAAADTDANAAADGTEANDASSENAE